MSKQLNEHMNNTKASKCSNQIEGHTDSKLERKGGSNDERNLCIEGRTLVVRSP